MKRRKAFTLVELLVVVAIIALLIALLLPQIAKAKEYAKMTKCAANMHAIGIGLATYAGNNNGYIIDAWDTKRDFGQGIKTSNWSDRLVMEGDVTQSLDATQNSPCVGRGVFQCPNHDKSVQFLLPGDPNNTGYDGYGITNWASSHWEYFQNLHVWIKHPGVNPDIDETGTFTNDSSISPGGQADTHLFQSRKLADLIPRNIYLVEGNSGINAQVGGTWAYWIYLRHFNRLLNGTISLTGSPPTYSSKQYTYTGRANYMMADFHVEVNIWNGSANGDPQSYYDKYPATFGAKKEQSPYWHLDN